MSLSLCLVTTHTCMVGIGCVGTSISRLVIMESDSIRLGCMDHWPSGRCYSLHHIIVTNTFLVCHMTQAIFELLKFDPALSLWTYLRKDNIHIILGELLVVQL